MRALLASLIIGVSVLGLSAYPNAKVPPAERCVTVADVRGDMGDQATERAYLDGQRVSALLAQLGNPDGITAALVVAVAARPDVLVIILFNDRGCAVGATVGPEAAVSRLLDPQT